ncbi:alpha/beta hydrolase [Hujiaoplasma nucleasis]|uniref:Alpha/beta hydrolase n=1 Tax=Hujiaoplasma nucleasis TaxID=2725268 RepID=A0A7L6N2K0_9MOLU|nr:alpha/beta hydrolase [Hujiaoplasma nucleasis]QLY39682.1 alpha/beta hydrolase [Hujiaoplasma nucleasis]
MKNEYYFLIGFTIIIAIYWFISYKLYRSIFFAYKNKPIDLVNHEDEFYQAAYQWFETIPKEDEYITAYDFIKLHGVFIPSHDKKSQKVAIVIHGYQSKATDMIIIAKMYSDLGFKVLIIDQRGHGLSEGNFTSVGYYEAYDLKKWLHFITRNHGADSQILLHGVSMGASTAAMAMKFREAKQVKALVLDSCFTNFRDSLALSTRQPILRLFLPGITFNTKLFLKFFLKEVNPLKAIKKTDIPVLLIHSENDRVVTHAMTETIYTSIKNKDKDLLIILGAKHAKGFEVEKQKYIDKVVDLTSKVFNIKKSDIKYIQ